MLSSTHVKKMASTNYCTSSALENNVYKPAPWAANLRNIPKHRFSVSLIGLVGFGFSLWLFFLVFTTVTASQSVTYRVTPAGCAGYHYVFYGYNENVRRRSSWLFLRGTRCHFTAGDSLSRFFNVSGYQALRTLAASAHDSCRSSHRVQSPYCCR